MTSASSTNVAAGDASNASIDWFVSDRQLGGRRLDQRSGMQVRDAVRVPEPNPALEHGRQVVEHVRERRAVLGERVELRDGVGELRGVIAARAGLAAP